MKELTEEGKKHGKAAAAFEVEQELNAILNSEMHKWFLGKYDAEEMKKRKEAAKKFRERYSTDN